MTADEQAIRGLIALWHRATAAGEVDTVLSLMSQDAVFLVSGKPAMRGRASFERALREVLREHRVQSSVDIQEVEIAGDLAYSWLELTVKKVPANGEAATTRSGSAVSIFRKQNNGAWVLVRDANLLAAAS